MINKKIVFFVFCCISSAAAFTIPTDLKNNTDRVVAGIINCDFEQVFKICDSMIVGYPEDPLPSVLKLCAMGMRDVDCEKTVDSAGFVSTFLATESLIQNYRKKHGTSSYILMLDGFTKAIHASFYLRKKSYFNVLQNGTDAIRLLKEAKELDSTNTDVDFFLGLYEYGKSELKKKLWWALFWYPGSKKDGIRRLNECSKCGLLTNTAAKLSLSDIYLQEKKPERSQEIIAELQPLYPNSRFVLWAKAKYLEFQKMYDSAAVVYEQLSVHYALIPECKQNFLSTRYRKAQMLNLAGNSKDAAEICRALLKDGQLDQYREIKKDTRRLLENLDDGKS